MKRNHIRVIDCWISVLGLLVLGTAFGIWWARKEPMSILACGSAVLSVLLFAAVCLRFVPQWTQFWWGESEEREGIIERRDTVPPIELRIFISLMSVNFAVIMAVFLLRKATGSEGTFLENLEFWRWTDSGHYLDISRDWYLSEGEWDRLVQLVFLPGYPIAVKLFTTLFGYDLYAGLAVSSLSFAGAGCVIYRLVRMDLGHEAALRTIKYFCILPGGFFFAAPMSESLFLLLTALCLYWARKGKWGRSCLIGGAAAFTRSLGLTLLAPVVLELVRAARARRVQNVTSFLSLLLIPAGFAAYCTINYLVSGNAFQFLEYQSEHWNQKLGFFFHTAAYQMEWVINAPTTGYYKAVGLSAPNLLYTFGSLIILLFTANQMRASYTAWFIGYYLIAIGATSLLSAPRYLLTLIPVPMAVSILTRKRAADRIVTLICAGLYLVYFYAFVMRWQVW